MESPELRRRTMQAVRSKNTRPELLVRRLLYANGYRYRLHSKKLPGCPDLVFPGRKKVLFIHGCWWHGHDCQRGSRVPKTNVVYWTKKVIRNRNRDADSRKQLEAQGWKVLTLWECELNDGTSALLQLARFLDKA
ncbi:MAG TPA: very short patch repair endonuclease [Pyrinomonadaceae bacterium]|nr:very short patch repair endonuclease [Pyrinomonadaceae bacterium]